MEARIGMASERPVSYCVRKEKRVKSKNSGERIKMRQIRQLGFGMC